MLAGIDRLTLPSLHRRGLEHRKDLAIRREAGLPGGGPEGLGDGAGGEQEWIHHGDPGEPALQQGPEGSLSRAASHHDLGRGIEQAHLQSGLEVHAAAGTHQQHGAGPADSCQLQDVRAAHVAQHQATFQNALQFGRLPGREVQVHPPEQHPELQQTLQAGLAQRSEPADNDGLLDWIPGHGETGSQRVNPSSRSGAGWWQS